MPSFFMELKAVLSQQKECRRQSYRHHQRCKDARRDGGSQKAVSGTASIATSGPAVTGKMGSGSKKILVK